MNPFLPNLPLLLLQFLSHSFIRSFLHPPAHSLQSIPFPHSNLPFCSLTLLLNIPHTMSKQPLSLKLSLHTLLSEKSSLSSDLSSSWYRHLPGRGPELLAVTVKESKELPDIAGGLWVSADRRSSALWLRRPRRGDAAVYYCARGDTGRGAGAAAGAARGQQGALPLGRRASGGSAAPSCAASPRTPRPTQPLHGRRTHGSHSLPPALTHSMFAGSLAEVTGKSPSLSLGKSLCLVLERG
uniref:Uncharacterized protein n=1 Tax=Corvus moneduloides TaxID=1196302 RepID=A0A8U7NJ52_CORMO